jgi:AcrR family transcriptional regulator
MSPERTGSTGTPAPGHARPADLAPFPLDDLAAVGGLRERKKQATRHALQSAGLSLVDERGLERVTVQEIAEAADVSPRTFFNYFPPKEAVLVGSDPTGPQRLAERFLARPDAEPPLVALRAVFLAQAEAIAESQPLWQLRQRVVQRNPSLWPALVGASADTERLLAEAVAERTRAAADDPYPALVAAVAAAAMRTSMQHCAATGFAKPVAELAESAFDALIAGLPPPGD